MVRYEPAKDWQEWVEGLAVGWHGRSRWRLSLILLGMVFARGRRTVTTWLRAVAIKQDFGDYYYFLQPLGRKSKELALRLFTLLLVLWSRASACCWRWTTRRPSATGRKYKALAFITIPRPARPATSSCMGRSG